MKGLLFGLEDLGITLKFVGLLQQILANDPKNLIDEAIGAPLEPRFGLEIPQRTDNPFDVGSVAGCLPQRGLSVGFFGVHAAFLDKEKVLFEALTGGESTTLGP